MADSVQQLSDWIDNKATQAGWTLQQIKDASISTIYRLLPAQYKAQLTDVIFAKAKRLLVVRRYKQALNSLKENTNIRQQILAVFPDATFELRSTPAAFEIAIKVPR